MPVGLAYGLLYEMGCLLLTCGILSILTLSGKLRMEYSGYGVLFMLMVSSYIGAATASEQIGHKRFLVCILSGVIYILMIAAVAALLCGVQSEALATSAFLIMGGCLTAALIGNPIRKRGRK